MARHSDLEAPNFSLLNSFDSQVLGSSDSLSLPSEPPDIRNWFSSYAYESPESNRVDEFEGCVGIRGSNCEKEGFDGEERNKEEENVGLPRIVRRRDELVVDKDVASIRFANAMTVVGESECARKVLDSSDSLSLYSEFQVSLLSLLFGDQTEHQSNYLGSADFSVCIGLSEPPNIDIEKWFSSYVYESPLLNTSDDFELSYLKESECDRGGFNAGKSSKREENLRESIRTGKGDELVAAEKMASNGVVKSNNPFENRNYGHLCVPKGNHGVDGCKNSGVIDDLPLQRISEPILEEATTQNPYSDAAKAAKNSSLYREDSAANNGGKSPTKLLHGRDFTGKAQLKNVEIQPQRSNAESATVNGDSMRKRTSGSNNKENDGHDFAGTAFISTKKCVSKRNDESSSKRLFAVKSVSLRNKNAVSTASDKGTNVGRNVLSEMTNIRSCDAVETAGKWRCPQKNKPNLGPPLKQLRLEQWVRRM